MTILTQSTNIPITRTNLETHARIGRTENITYLMDALEKSTTFSGRKLIDYALGQVTSMDGQNQIQHYLFHGSPVQRNYAALYFKRRGNQTMINQAVQQGCIDEIQGNSK